MLSFIYNKYEGEIQNDMKTEKKLFSSLFLNAYTVFP